MPNGIRHANAFKENVAHLLDGRDNQKIKASEDKLKIGYSTISGRLKYWKMSDKPITGKLGYKTVSERSAAATQPRVMVMDYINKSAAAALRTHINSLSREFGNRESAVLADAQGSIPEDVQNAVLPFLNRGVLKDKDGKQALSGHSRLTVKDVRNATEKAEEAVAKTMEKVNKQLHVAAALDRLMPRAEEIIKKNNPGASAEELQKKNEAVEKGLKKFLTSKEIGSDGALDSSATQQAHGYIDQLVAAEQTAPAKPVPPETKATAAPEPEKSAPVTRPKISHEDARALGKQKGQEAVAKFKQGTRVVKTSFKSTQAHAQYATKLQEDIEKIVTNALLADKGPTLDAQVDKAVAEAVANFNAL